jgi:pimeloyl-ACP methyl ester carboxylesterase
LFTHGWSLDRSDWDGVRAALGDRYHLVFWELAGLGRSTAPRTADHSLEKMAADLEAVLMQATAGPIILVGHSIGGMIQQTFCRLFPQHLEQRVRGLVFVHTTYTNPAKTALGSIILTALQKPVLEPLTFLTIWLAPLMWLSNWQSYWNGSLHLSTRLTSFAGKQTWKHLDHASRLQACAWPAVVGRGMLAMTRFDEQATLPQIHVPALVIAGQDDRLTKPGASQVLAQRLPEAKLITLQPAGHFGLWEQRVEFEAALADFADSLTSKREPIRGSVVVS